MSQNADDNWDIDTDELRSVDSAELHETRPNRWTGPASTWRKLTAQDRHTHAALEAVRNRDLSVHLYNAFALKNRRVLGQLGGPDADDINKETGASARVNTEWVPDKLWTAWPLKPGLVPPDDFMSRADDEDDEDGINFRRPPSRAGPEVALEEELSATILRLAKEKFRQRNVRDEDEREPVVISSVEDAAGESSDITLPDIKAESGLSGSGEEDEEQTEARESDVLSEARRKRRRTGPTTFFPTVSADDELSYELLRPMTRHILSNLDRTLTVLHNARVAGIDYGSDSGEEEEEEAQMTDRRSVVSRDPKQQVKQDDQTDSEVPIKPTSRRFDLHTPREGETEREMKVRLARKWHRRIPSFSDEEGDTTAAETAGGSKSRRGKQIKSEPVSASKLPESKTDPDVNRGRRLGDWALRDWSDVLGAAALAGFSPNVIARATQRCADLFGQGMEFNTLAEEPAANRGRKSRTTRYMPGQDALSTSEEDSEERYRSEAEQIRAVSRASSVILGESSSEEESLGSRRRSRRSYSVGPSVVRVYCPHAGCSGAINGFGRRFNLTRHLQVMHGKNTPLAFEDDDDIDEVHGAVHVDGFLKPIRPRKGWRAGDAQPGRARSRRSRTRTRNTGQFYSDDGYHAELTDTEPFKPEEDDGDDYF